MLILFMWVQIYIKKYKILSINFRRFLTLDLGIERGQKWKFAYSLFFDPHTSKITYVSQLCDGLDPILSRALVYYIEKNMPYFGTKGNET